MIHSVTLQERNAHARHDGHSRAQDCRTADCRAKTLRRQECQSALRRALPALPDHRLSAPRRAPPHFSFEYSDGGSGKDDAGIKRNWAGLDAVELVPRYGVMASLPPCDVELFGRRYAAPIGIAPMGGPAIVWPGADEYLARAAQRARIPYTFGVVGCSTIEKIAEVAPDVCWFQLYRAAKNDHAIGFDLVRS